MLQHAPSQPSGPRGGRRGTPRRAEVAPEAALTSQSYSIKSEASSEHNSFQNGQEKCTVSSFPWPGGPSHRTSSSPLAALQNAQDLLLYMVLYGTSASTICGSAGAS